jgi:hypothetical protein
MENLVALHDRILERTDLETSAVDPERLWFTEIGGKLYVEFYGRPFDTSYFELLDVLSSPAVAPGLAFLSLRGPDEGVNGTRAWDLSKLVEPADGFPALLTFSVEQIQPGHHNRTVIGAPYDENGTIARLLAKAPELKNLTLPSAPNSDFFALSTHPLATLNLDAGYDTQDFIRNFAASKCFPMLTSLEWGEYNETYVDEFEAMCTPFADYNALFSSEAFQRVRSFVWRNPVCSSGEISALKQLRPDLQLLIVRTSSEYIRT